MTCIPIDAALAAQLAGLTGEEQLVGPDGQVVGRVRPPLIPPGWEPSSPGITEEELERRRKSGGRTFTTAEVLKHLESL
ncbi:MAG: hypothetical protein ACRC33_11000 [Gemmataceae bacterium]